ncbi:phosphatidate cytidylyltransferase [Ferruginibacter albus]|uniref:phosphatidate cytidylyltransferase n=1 Tax=Ferruginibacter albus TaxID=2875540 RepID=UPI001CC459AD|nr:phosphatidate cytidylyltransferase [Ferruginibacter albus]UAY53347.1 phosphatidate cytidylyltransferase [Ferruginibacter albus]
MKKNNQISLSALFFLITLLNSCRVVGDIFKAGVWVGVILIIVVIAIVVFIVSRI